MFKPILKGPTPVPKKVYKGLQKISKSNQVNMLDAVQATRMAIDLGLQETVNWLRANKTRYLSGVYNGFVPEEGAPSNE